MPSRAALVIQTRWATASIEVVKMRKVIRLLMVFGMRKTSQFVPIAVFVAATAVGSAVAADIPKEGTYDFTSCWSGVSSVIAFSKTHSAISYEFTGASRSNPPGGLGHKNTFRCVGVNYSFGGKAGGTTVCEAVDPEGDKRLTYFFFQGVNVVREQIAGTGKYDGMTMSGAVQPLGPFPVIKPGTFQDCNDQTGTYKLK